MLHSFFIHSYRRTPRLLPNVGNYEQDCYTHLCKGFCVNTDGRWNLIGYSPWERKESEATEWFHSHFQVSTDFPSSSVDKESACDTRDTGDAGSIPGSGRCSGEGNGNLLQYSWMDNSMDVSLAGYSPRGHKELDMTEQLNHHYCPEVELGGC